MSGFFDALLHHSFLQNALLAGILASIVCGVMGTFVVIKRITFISGGIAHAVLGGVGIAYFLNIEPLIGAFAFAILAAIIIGLVKLKAGQQEDTVISALWAIGMALGVIFMYLTPGYSVDLLTYLFGNILMVTKSDLLILVILNVTILSVVFVLYRQFISISFDEEYSRLRGLNVNVLYIFLLILIALTIVVLIQIVGLILVIALLTLPAAIAGLFTRTPASMMVLAVILGMLFTGGGMILSYEPNLPVGASIIILSGVVYLVALNLKKMISKK
ncbi:MAG: metal ABC transporter permease [Candidatus Cloacimonetes bacterium]|nr:metal ABC transporter permease [Candidatus Cloacimonadota bacterium]